MNILYLKESPLGLKYLGKCVNVDPLTYMGSGKYWRLHIKKHGFTHKDIKTTILLETDDVNEIKKWGEYYSNLWDIVKSKDFANLRPENGDGGWGHIKGKPKTEEWKKMMSERVRTPEERKKMSDARKNYKATPETIEKLRKSHTGIKYSDETNKRRGLSISKTRKGKPLSSKHKEALKKPKDKIKNNDICPLCGVYTTKTVISRNHGYGKCKK